MGIAAAPGRPMRRSMQHDVPMQDDSLVAYLLAARPVQEQLQEILLQLAAYSLLQTVAPGRAQLDIGPIDRAREAFAEPVDAAGSLRVPPQAAHHHHHLCATLDALGRALAAGYSSSVGHRTTFFAAIEEAERHLRATSRALPGFEMVDLTNACCAAHAVQSGAMEVVIGS